MRRRGVVAVAGRCAALLLAVGVIAGCGPKRVKRPYNLTRYQQNAEWPRPEVMAAAESAWRCGRSTGDFQSPVLTVIDYSLPSTERRLWVIDMVQRRVLSHELVAHGENSGDLYAVAFSNRMGSNQTSLGLFRTEGTYYGHNGYSLRLDGLERGINDRAYERKIVVHGANYVQPAVIASFGRLGRSHGCPAVPHAAARRIIDQIKGGSAVFAYYPDPWYMQSSAYLRCDGSRMARR
jgi:hypothetical protein